MTTVCSAQKIDLRKEFGCEQLIIVTSADWQAIQGKMNVYEWKDNSWNAVMKNIPITLGRTGLAWAKGLQNSKWNTGELKKEGDGKSPAGIFRIGGLFGYGDLETKMNYLKLNQTTFCVDDTASSNYNRIVDTATVSKNWNSAEKMRRNDDLYKYGVLVDYNSENVIEGAGSCIFIHIWRGNDQPTLGCTAMTEANILKLIHFLNKEKKPLLVQMPEKELQEFSKEYKLPSH
ncbi:L,D-peptidoglycan transpeptidase YkuD, ErfK/YbiS/YcfS/YnhG family [Solitalea koreensis]|uniref:L,D-peptidoglycan transpeptidase YkuD, ErfK/YbiS/YcfS/YnhG family n=2 Tax=Solitalea koreensis TaxID=543615 RepID=A0A521C194_9SPHI|nr:L,D-peptidoglycan transpeptidase YkuD, ErfK/YbiS/YcfS/YnhG family [Solitalea koreensis]